MSEDLHEELTDVLDRASAERESLLASDEQSDGETETDSTALLEAAEEASDLLESNEPGDVLEALELDTLPDGSTASSIPEAIAKGDADDVATLQQLLRLANLADHDAADLDGALGSLRDGIDAGRDDHDSAEDETTAGDSDEESSDDAETKTETETTEDTDSERDEADDSGTASELTEQLRSSMESSLSAFSEDIGSLQDGLEAVQSGLGDADESDGDANGDVEKGSSDSDEERTADSDEDDDLLEADLEPDLGGERGNSAGGDGTRYSTMAPPPSERADMKGTARFSTMPDRN